MAVTFAELDGSPVERQGEEGVSASIRLLCDWKDRWALIAEKLAYGGEFYPHKDGCRARARRASIEPFPAQQGEISPGYAKYEKAVVTVEYDVKGPETEDLISESLEPTAEFMTLDHQDFRWGSAVGEPLKEGEAPGRLVRGFDYKVTFHHVPTIPIAVVTLVGCCNSSAVVTRTLGLTFAAETLLYQPPTITRKVTTEEVEAWEVVLRFTFKPVGWNTYWRSATQQYERMYHKDGGGQPYYSYPLGDFGALL